MALVVREIEVLVLFAVLHSGELRGHDVLDGHDPHDCGDAAIQDAPRGGVPLLGLDHEGLRAVATSGISYRNDAVHAEQDGELADAPLGGSGRVRLEAVD